MQNRINMYQCEFKMLNKNMQNFFGFIKIAFASLTTIFLMCLYPWGTQSESAAFGLFLIGLFLFVSSLKFMEWLINKLFYNFYYKKGILLHYTKSFDPFVEYHPNYNYKGVNILLTVLSFRDGSKTYIYETGETIYTTPKGDIIYEK